MGDASIKFLTVHYPPDKTGPKALFGYSGLAILPDGTPTATWIRETLRGETDVFDASMAHLRERLDRDIAPLGIPLQITVLVAQRERRCFGGLSNVLAPDGPFGYQMQELTAPFAFAHGSGMPRVMASADVGLLKAQLKVMPREPLDHMRRLAAVNRRAAGHEPTVSPFCHVAYVNGDDRTKATSRAFTERGESAPFEVPILLFGIDLTDMMRDSVRQSKRMRTGEDLPEPPDVDAMNARLRRRPRPAYFKARQL
jgi:hypothetical protein